jgi:hypothetical protein
LTRALGSRFIGRIGFIETYATGRLRILRCCPISLYVQKLHHFSKRPLIKAYLNPDFLDIQAN